MPNMNAIINGHNKKVLSEEQNRDERTCNCRNPVDEHSLTSGVIYEATVNSDLPQYEQRIYKGITERVFKERNKEQNQAFTNPNKETDNKLSEEIWRIKEAGGTPQVTRKILERKKLPPRLKGAFFA